MKVWVTRDKSKHKYGGIIDINKGNKPVMLSNDKFYSPSEGEYSLVLREAANNFKSLFGFTPRKGSCTQMNLELTEIE